MQVDSDENNDSFPAHSDVGVDAFENEQDVEADDEERPEKGADDVSVSTEERGPADDDRRDRIEFVGHSGAGVTVGVASGEDETRQRDAEPVDRIGSDPHTIDRNSGIASRNRVSAHRIDPPSKNSFRKDDRGDNREDDHHPSADRQPANPLKQELKLVAKATDRAIVGVNIGDSSQAHHRCQRDHERLHLCCANEPTDQSSNPCSQQQNERNGDGQRASSDQPCRANAVEQTEQRTHAEINPTRQYHEGHPEGQDARHRQLVKDIGEIFGGKKRTADQNSSRDKENPKADKPLVLLEGR